MHPLVDILCLCYNQIPVTQQFIKHLFDHTQNFRISFLDNGSTDETPQYLGGLAQLHSNCFYFRSNENIGIIRGRNLLADKVFSSSFFAENPSDYFLNIDNDQYVGKTWLIRLFDLMFSGYDLVGIDAWKLLPPGSRRNIVMNGQVLRDASYFPFRQCEQKHEQFSYVGCGGCLIRKQVYDTIGLFDERFGMCYFEDPDFCYRSFKQGFKIAWLHNCPVIHLAHKTINTQTSYNKQKEFLASWMAFRDKWYPYFPEFISKNGD